MFRESAFQIDAVSAADAHGLVQIVPATAWQISRKYKIDYQNEFDLYMPQKNLLIGSYYMAELLKKYSGNKEAVLAAYNAGPSRSTRWLKEFDNSDTDLWIEQIGIEQTRTYIKKVMFAYYAYKLINKNNQNVYLKPF
jgi:soluble lytic murein transglycosylase